MYIVPMEIPQYCNKCPFGRCYYSFPLGSSSISDIDGEENKTGTHGYTCNIDFDNNGKYTKIMRADYGENIQKPEWCPLVPMSEDQPLDPIISNHRYICPKCRASRNINQKYAFCPSCGQKLTWNN